MAPNAFIKYSGKTAIPALAIWAFFVIFATNTISGDSFTVKSVPADNSRSAPKIKLNFSDDNNDYKIADGRGTNDNSIKRILYLPKNYLRLLSQHMNIPDPNFLKLDIEYINIDSNAAFCIYDEGNQKHISPTWIPNKLSSHTNNLIYNTFTITNKKGNLPLIIPVTSDFIANSQIIISIQQQPANNSDGKSKMIASNSVIVSLMPLPSDYTVTLAYSGNTLSSAHLENTNTHQGSLIISTLLPFKSEHIVLPKSPFPLIINPIESNKPFAFSVSPVFDYHHSPAILGNDINNHLVSSISPSDLQALTYNSYPISSTASHPNKLFYKKLKVEDNNLNDGMITIVFRSNIKKDRVIIVNDPLGDIGDTGPDNRRMLMKDYNYVIRVISEDFGYMEGVMSFREPGSLWAYFTPESREFIFYKDRN